ncbi:MmgE/PrpD family protein [Salinicola rhizosphaerae]|uniref:2-methylcitrate dehydratase n=1 Tax=Salinicola rhizosphaerae TaxID=1443141 RepID=A0ABQ3DVF7_9GAMM|nr:MmgE/PrpD family protein [Salinicola rhizosphaerae]GHB17088.1 2-methylcitrate dehydratase [Salinicola rhizosphaerae]
MNNDNHASSDHTAKLGAFVSQLDFEALPTEVVKRARHAILDTLGVILGAVALPPSRQLLDMPTTLGAHRFAAVDRATPAMTALVLGTLSDMLELQDGWRFGGIHACLVIPAALAVAGHRPVSGRSLIAAVVGGYEVAHRVAWAGHPQHMASGYMPNGTAGTVGSAAAAGALLGLDAPTQAGALGTAAFLLPVSTAENLWSGYPAKPLHTGYAAKTGVEAAMLAQMGFGGCPIEGSSSRGRGFLEITSGKPVLERLSEGLEQRWTLTETYFKFYPICRQAQAAAEAALEVAASIKGEFSRIRRVTLSTYALSAQLLDRQISAESGMVAAQFSLPYIIATILKNGRMTQAELAPGALSDLETLNLSRRVEIAADDAMTQRYPQSTPAVVEVELDDGRLLRGACDAPKGDPSRPVEEKELVDKATALCAWMEAPGEVQRLCDQVLALETLDSVEPLLRQLDELMTLARSRPAVT